MQNGLRPLEIRLAADEVQYILQPIASFEALQPAGAREGVTMTSTGQRRFYTELESLRGIAALTVVIFHVFAAKLPDPKTLSHLDFTAVANLILTSLFGGTGAVSLFFVLSGFVLAESLGRLNALSSRSYLEFMTKRAFRLMPAAWASIVLAIVLFKITQSPIRWDLLIDALLLKQPVLTYFNGPLWSLHVEMWASAVFPMLVFANRYISAPFQIVIVAVLLWLPYSGICPYWAIFFFCFQFGLMIRSVFIPFYQRLPDRVSLSVFIASLLTVTVPTNLSLMGYLGTIDHTHIEGLGASMVISYLLVPRGAWLAQALNMAPLRFLGRISYSLYVFHFPLTDTIEHLVWRNLIYQPYLPAQLVCLSVIVPVCLVAGTCGYYLIERPCLRLGRQLAASFRPHSGAPVAPARNVS